MVKKLLSCSLAAGLLFASAAASADDKPAAAKPMAKPADKPDAKATDKPAAHKPPAELDALAFLAGTFTCKGTFTKNPGDTPVPTKARIASKWALDKFFLTFTYDQPKTKEQPVHVAAEGYFGWDAGVKRYVHGAIDNGGLSLLLHADKEADTFVFKGEASGPVGTTHAPVVFTFKKADKGFMIIVEENRDGKLVKTSEETCSK